MNKFLLFTILVTTTTLSRADTHAFFSDDGKEAKIEITGEDAARLFSVMDVKITNKEKKITYKSGFPQIEVFSLICVSEHFCKISYQDSDSSSSVNINHYHWIAEYEQSKGIMSYRYWERVNEVAKYYFPEWAIPGWKVPWDPNANYRPTFSYLYRIYESSDSRLKITINANYTDDRDLFFFHKIIYDHRP